MPTIIIIIALAIGLIIGICFLVRAYLFKKHLVKNFKRCNVVVDGKKGTGKDLIFQAIVNARKEEYYANIDYGGKLLKEITPKDVSIFPNTYKSFIDNNITLVERTFKEKCDIYISDGGIYLPSYMDSTLYKQFPSFPLFYALSRHLYNNNIHVNVQNFGRLWKALREQADFFIHVVETRSFLFWTFTKAITYDKYDTAIKYMLPLTARLLNKYSKAEVDIYHASNGDIRSGWIIQLKRNIKYNTRAFEPKVLAGERIE